MSRPMVTIIDVSNQEEIVREMNDEEYAQYLLDIEEDKKRDAERLIKEQEAEAVKAATEAKLASLGLDLETVKLLAKLG